ncbi:MAG: serine hydrolase domain-containing protein [Herpetosiphon sp.]
MTVGDRDSLRDSRLDRRLMAMVQDAVATTSTPGAAVTLLLDGQAVFVAGIGFRDLERTAVLDAHAQFYIYSVTKTLIATAILQLVEQGHIVLDTPIQGYVPQLPLDTPVTVRQLLNHSGGIPDYGGLPTYFEALKACPQHPWTSEEFLSYVMPEGLIFVPGQGWSYSNIGFLLLRRLIAVVTNASLRTTLHEQIFAPLGLEHTFVAETLADARQLAPGYSSFFSPDDSLQDIRPLYHPGWVSHGVVVATAPELARVVDGIFAGRFLRADSLAAMREPVLVPMTHPLFRQPAYGLGLMLDLRSRHGVIAGHGGGGPGYSAAALHVPDVHGRRITSIVLANRDQSDLSLRTAFTMAMMLADTLVR